MIIGRTSLGRVAATKNQLALCVKATCGGREMGGCGGGEGMNQLTGSHCVGAVE